MKKKYSIAIHGGSSAVYRKEEKEERIAGLKQALEKGLAVLHKGGSALQAVHDAVCALEDFPMFNAGRGAAFSANEEHYLSASLMDGHSLESGAVSAVQGVKNPVTLAKEVFESSPHAFLVSHGAETFGRKQGVEFCTPDYFATERRKESLKHAKEQGEVYLDDDMLEKNSDIKTGTVGAVAYDSHGNLAAATSTGGLTNQMVGRVPDSAVIGAGTYANNKTCAISCTGKGEEFIKTSIAFHIHSLMTYKGYSLANSLDYVFEKILPDPVGGIIGVDTKGVVVSRFNTKVMYRAWSNGKQSFFELE